MEEYDTMYAHALLLDPTSMNNNGPKLIRRAHKASCFILLGSSLAPSGANSNSLNAQNLHCSFHAFLEDRSFQEPAKYLQPLKNPFLGSSGLSWLGTLIYHSPQSPKYLTIGYAGFPYYF